MVILASSCLLHNLRSAPCHHHPELLAEYDVFTRSTTEALCNIHLDDNNWPQAILPDRNGGLGLRAAADLALPAFLFSRAASVSLVNDILRQPTNKQENDDEVRAWLDRNLVLPSITHKQRNWDDIQSSSAVATLVPVLNQHHLAYFKAASRPDSGVRLNCVPNNSFTALSSTTTLSVSASLSASDSRFVFLIDANVKRRWTHSVLTLCRAASAQDAFIVIPPKTTSFDVAFLQLGYRPCSNRLVLTAATENDQMEQQCTPTHVAALSSGTLRVSTRLHLRT